jgi:hypothetical protein
MTEATKLEIKLAQQFKDTEFPTIGMSGVFQDWTKLYYQVKRSDFKFAFDK